MPIKPRALVRAIEKAGGTQVKGGKSGHRVVVYNGLRAHVPFHGGGYEISDGLLRKILADLELTRQDLGI